MIRNYFKIAWRNITLHKGHTTINILGLAFGICACITIFLITSYELSFEKFHPDKERIYRIVGDMTRSNGESFFLNCPVVEPEAMNQSTAIITWPQYFDIFNYQWLEGNAESLDEPFRVVLSENRARKYFGNIPLANMMGKIVIYDDSLQVRVSGIVKD